MLKPDVWYIMALHGTTGGSDMIIQLKWIEMVHEVHEQQTETAPVQDHESINMNAFKLREKSPHGMDCEHCEQQVSDMCKEGI